MEVGKHQFVPLAKHQGELKGSCVKCAMPYSHTIHHQVTAAEPELKVPKVDRIGRDEMFLEIARTLRKRSTCLRGKVGCVIVQDRRIVSTGYNGAPPGAPHCFEIGCEAHENEHVEGCLRAVHAEANAVAFAARHGVGTMDSAVYCTHSPCGSCAKLLVSAGVTRFVYEVSYRDERLDILRESGLEVVKIP